MHVERIIHQFLYSRKAEKAMRLKGLKCFFVLLNQGAIWVVSTQNMFHIIISNFQQLLSIRIWVGSLMNFQLLLDLVKWRYKKFNVFLTLHCCIFSRKWWNKLVLYLPFSDSSICMCGVCATVVMWRKMSCTPTEEFFYPIQAMPHDVRESA